MSPGFLLGRGYYSESLLRNAQHEMKWQLSDSHVSSLDQNDATYSTILVVDVQGNRKCSFVDRSHPHNQRAMSVRQADWGSRDEECGGTFSLSLARTNWW